MNMNSLCSWYENINEKKKKRKIKSISKFSDTEKKWAYLKLHSGRILIESCPGRWWRKAREVTAGTKIKVDSLNTATALVNAKL